MIVWNKFMRINNTKELLLAFASLTTLSLSACGDGQQAGGAAQQMPPAQVNFEYAEVKDVPVSTYLTGRATAVRTAEVRPQVSGIILKRLFTEGTVVQEGQQLYQIDPAVYEAQLASAKAELARAQATYNTNKLRYDRYANLIRTKAISQQDYDDAKANYESANASILAAKATVKTAQINLDYTKVYAPITGTIGRSNVTEGALVTSGQPQQLATIQQLDPMYIDLGESVAKHIGLQRQVKAGSFIADNSSGQVELFFENGAKYEHKGSIAFSEVTVDQSTGMLIQRVSVPNPDNMLLPGMYVSAKVTAGTKKDAVLIPQIAVLRLTNGTQVVYTISNQNCPPNVKECVAQNIIETDGEIDNKYIIKSGVQKGDRVITTNLQKIGPGAPVIPVAPDATKTQTTAK